MSPSEQMVIAVPDVEVREINEDWEFILLACDGIWDVVTNTVSSLLSTPNARGCAQSKGCMLTRWCFPIRKPLSL
jgi:serine/threonine protein phosphatase PrpC